MQRRLTNNRQPKVYPIQLSRIMTWQGLRGAGLEVAPDNMNKCCTLSFPHADNRANVEGFFEVMCGFWLVMALLADSAHITETEKSLADSARTRGLEAAARLS
jgi:hypothetical protein